MMEKKNVFEKMVMQKTKSKRSHEDHKRKQCNKMLININVLGSTGPIKFVVNEKDTVSMIIETALKSYAREGRLPLLGFDPINFLLYCANIDFDALNPLEAIGSFGVRNFVLCKKPNTELISQKKKSNGDSVWKAWFNKSFGLKISAH